MPWIYRSRYDPYYDRRWQRRAMYPGNSCLRDACLLETGCCIAEGLDGNCLMLTIPLLPRFLLAMGSGAGGPGRTREGSGPAARAVLAAIRVYQRDVSARRPACCRFSPSCSEYAAQAVTQRGAVRGLLLAGRRLLRCRPGGARGADPVPA